jgi:hypothetical protein
MIRGGARNITVPPVSRGRGLSGLGHRISVMRYATAADAIC